MIVKLMIEQSVADNAAAGAFEQSVVAAFPNAQIRGSRMDYVRLGAAKVAEEAARQVVVKAAIVSEVRAEATATIAAEQRVAVVDDILAGRVTHPRITVAAEAAELLAK